MYVLRTFGRSRLSALASKVGWHAMIQWLVFGTLIICFVRTAVHMRQGGAHGDSLHKVPSCNTHGLELEIACSTIDLTSEAGGHTQKL